MTHAWCHDVARDAAVRAAEDGRTRPLPTLEQCIEAMIPKSVSGSSAVEHQNKGDGMRTERVTLEITQFNNSGYKKASEWDWDFFLRGEALTHGESVRVVSDDPSSDADAEVLRRALVKSEIQRLKAESEAERLRKELEARTSTAGEGSCVAQAASGNSTAQPYGSQAASGGGSAWGRGCRKITVEWL